MLLALVRQYLTSYLLIFPSRLFRFSWVYFYRGGEKKMRRDKTGGGVVGKNSSENTTVWNNSGCSFEFFNFFLSNF